MDFAYAGPVTIAGAWEPEPATAERVERLRLRLYDVASELRPIDGPAELHDRLQAVAQELFEIQAALRLLVHVTALEEGDFLTRLDEIDKRLASGDWKPPSADAGGVITRLRSALAVRQ